MFKKNPLTTFNNMMFSAETIEAMPEIHASAQRLYEAAQQLRAVTGQSAVARLLDVTPQVVKNWEKRGMSESGALRAQLKIGCDANWLLLTGQTMRLDAWAPDPIRSQEPAPKYLPDRIWPFRQVTREQFNQLTIEQLNLVESNILMFLAAREPPINQRPPESYGTAA